MFTLNYIFHKRSAPPEKIDIAICKIAADIPEYLLKYNSDLCVSRSHLIPNNISHFQTRFKKWDAAEVEGIICV